MIRIAYQYPGDPISLAILCFGAEFLLLEGPNRSMTFTIGGETIVVPLGNDIVCDCCNATVRDVDPCVLTPDVSRLYCWTCGDEYVVKHRITLPPPREARA
jgi:hypothetical protein